MAKVEELRYPHVKQVGLTKAKLASKMFRPSEEGKPVFVAGSKNLPKTFSSQGYFKTVFHENADDVARQELERKQQE